MKHYFVKCPKCDANVVVEGPFGGAMHFTRGKEIIHLPVNYMNRSNYPDISDIKTFTYMVGFGGIGFEPAMTGRSLTFIELKLMDYKKTPIQKVSPLKIYKIPLSFKPGSATCSFHPVDEGKLISQTILKPCKKCLTMLCNDCEKFVVKNFTKKFRGVRNYDYICVFNDDYMRHHPKYRTIVQPLSLGFYIATLVD